MYRKRLEVFLFFCHIPLLAFVNLWLNLGFLFPEKNINNDGGFIYMVIYKNKILQKSVHNTYIKFYNSLKCFLQFFPFVFQDLFT